MKLRQIYAILSGVMPKPGRIILGRGGNLLRLVKLERTRDRLQYVPGRDLSNLGGIMETWQVVAAVLGSVIALPGAVYKVLKDRADYREAKADADKAEESAREASEAKKLRGRFPNLQLRVINALYGFYRKDSQAVFPADELPKLLEMHPDDLDAVLQDLRSSAHIVVMRHPSHPGALVKLTPQGVDFAAKNPAEPGDAANRSLIGGS